MKELKPERILITGVSGFVGSFLVERCFQQFPEATIYGVYNHQEPLLFTQAMGKARMLKADITKIDQVYAAVAQTNPDLVFHLAARSSVALSWSDPIRTLHVNALGALNLLEAVRSNCDAARVVLIGSGEEYGDVKPEANPINEEYPLRPTNPYAVSKATQDLYGYQYYASYKLDVIRVRAFNHFGPFQPQTFVIPSFARQIALIEQKLAPPIVVVGNLEARRDFLPVEDVVDAYVVIGERGLTGEVYNVGSGKARSIRELLGLLTCLSEVPVSICEDDTRMRHADNPFMVADITRIQSQLGWRPHIPFESALKATLSYWRAEAAAIVAESEAANGEYL